MKDITIRRACATAFCVAAATLATGAMAKEQQYHVEALGATSDTGVQVGGIDRRGWVAGAANGHAAIFQQGAATRDLGTLGGASSVAYDANDQGVVVGGAALAGTGPSAGTHAFSWHKGTMTDLGALPRTPGQGSLAYALAVNATGQATGYSAVDAWNSHAFLASGGTLTDIGGLPNAVSSFGQAINDAGHIAGYSVVGTTGSTAHAFLYRDGAMIDLQPASDPTASSYGSAINVNDEIAGTASHTGFQPLRSTAFVWSNGVMTDLGTVAPGVSSISSASAINDAGVVVGTSANDAANKTFVAFVVRHGVMHDLNAELDAASVAAGWHLTSATGVNAKGEICGLGTLNGVTRAFVATPLH